MLSGETASGAHPIEAVRTMARIIEEIEKSAYYRANIEPPTSQLAVSRERDRARGGDRGARDEAARRSSSVSDSGGAARLLSEYRPEANIVCADDERGHATAGSRCSGA